MTTVLVTGADSQLSKCIKDVSVKFTDLKFIYKKSKELDVTKSSSIEESFKNQQIDYCINCAAYTNVDKAELEPEIAKNVNTNGPKNLAIICNKYNTVLIHISTDFVFDGESQTPYKETDTTRPLNVYGLTKRNGENEIKKHWEKHYIIRTSWLYSEYGSNFLKTILKLSKEKNKIEVVNDQIGSPTYAKDLANVILEFICFRNNSYGIYNYSNFGDVSWFDFAKVILTNLELKILLKPVTSEYYTSQVTRPKFSILNKQKIKNNLKLDIPFWETSLERAMTSINRTENLETAIRASLIAGKEIMRVYDGDIKVEYKDDKSPLTEADKKANDVINKCLLGTKIPIISEENREIDFDIRKKWNKCWVVDPVDGTKEFIKRNGEFTVNIALIENNKPVLGVIYVPVSKTLYFGDIYLNESFKVQLNSHEISMNEINNKREKLIPKKETSNIKVVGSRSHMNEETLNYVEYLKFKGKNIEIISKGSSLKFCLIAEGLADVYPRFAPTMEWDTAAGQAICNAVGVTVISKATNKSLSYNKENLLNPSFLVRPNAY